MRTLSEQGWINRIANYKIRDDAQQAFTNAIKTGRLSDDRNAGNYAGNYMYMCTGNDGRDQFKHILTRRYDV